MKFEPVEMTNGGQIFASELEKARFATYADWRSGVEKTLAELNSALVAGGFILLWQTYYARRADEMDENYLDSSESEVLLGQIEQILQRSLSDYTSFTLSSGRAMESGSRMWIFEWSGIETDETGCPLVPHLANAFNSENGWDSDQPRPGGLIMRTAPHDAEASRQAALDAWFGGEEENATAFFKSINEEIGHDEFPIP